MKNRDKIMEQTLVRLRAIKTLAQFKAAKEEITELIGKIMKSAIDLLSAFLKKMDSMSPEDQAAGAARFQDDNFLISAEVMQEVERLNNLPGGSKFAESFSLELEKIMKPHMEEFTTQMQKLMENLMGGIFGGLTDAMDQAFSSVSEEPATESEPEFVFDEDNPDMLYILYALSLYSMKSLSDLEAGKDSLVENLEMEINMQKSNLDNYLLPGMEDFWEEEKGRIAETQRLADRLLPEMENQFARISAVSGSDGSVDKIRKEIMNHLEPKITDLKKYLTAKRKEWPQQGYK